MICLMDPANYLRGLIYDPEPKGVGKDDLEATGVYLSDWELTELSSGRHNTMKAIQSTAAIAIGVRELAEVEGS